MSGNVKSRCGATILAFALALPGCSDPVGLRAATIEGLELELDVAPAAVLPGGSFLADVAIHNTLPDSVTLTSACSTLAWIGLYRGDERVSAEGTEFGCLTVITPFTIAPGGTLRQEWTVTALSPDGTPLPSGEYTFRVDFQVPLPDLESTLVIR